MQKNIIRNESEVVIAGLIEGRHVDIVKEVLRGHG
jgi:hypothetical protein